MKELMKFFPHPVIVGFMAGILQLTEFLCGGWFIGWAGFAACACYFMGGCTLKGGLNVLACWAAGVGAAITIFIGGPWLSEIVGSAPLGWSVVVGTVTFCSIFFEKAPFMNLIPMWFIGAASYFAFQKFMYASLAEGETIGYGPAAIRIVLSCIIGQTIAFIIAVGRTQYGAWMEKREAATA